MRLTEIGDQVMDGMTKDAGAGEMAAINSLLRKLPDADRLDLDEAIGGAGCRPARSGIYGRAESICQSAGLTG